MICITAVLRVSDSDVMPRTNQSNPLPYPKATAGKASKAWSWPLKSHPASSLIRLHAGTCVNLTPPTYLHCVVPVYTKNLVAFFQSNLACIRHTKVRRPLVYLTGRAECDTQRSVIVATTSWPRKLWGCAVASQGKTASCCGWRLINCDQLQRNVGLWFPRQEARRNYSVCNSPFFTDNLDNLHV